MEYYVKDNQKIFGPVEMSKITMMIASKKFSENVLLSEDGKNWFPVDQKDSESRNIEKPQAIQPNTAKPGAPMHISQNIPPPNGGFPHNMRPPMQPNVQPNVPPPVPPPQMRGYQRVQPGPGKKDNSLYIALGIGAAVVLLIGGLFFIFLFLIFI